MTHSYFSLSRRLAYVIAFTLPFFLLYEIGLFFGLHGDTINGGDAFFRLIYYELRLLLGAKGVAVVLGVGFAYFLYSVRHILFSDLKTLKPLILFGMVLESILFTAALFVLLSFVTSSSAPLPYHERLIRALPPLARVVRSTGAGVFEELFFRVFLINFIYAVTAAGDISSFTQILKRSIVITHLSDAFTLTDRFPIKPALWRALCVSSFIFAFLHLSNGIGLFGFLQIFIYGLIFGVIYLFRGYGIAVGVHTFYDLALDFGILP